MHKSCMTNAERFVNKYLNIAAELKILDVGSFNVNGTLRPIFTYGSCICSTCGGCDGINPISQPPICCGKPMLKGYVCDGVVFRPHTISRIGIKWQYIGMDLAESCKPYVKDVTRRDQHPEYRKYNVDLLMNDPYRFPLLDNEIDIIVSTSCLEHNQFFWRTFEEMVRVTKTGGYIYLNVPSNGPYHGYPLDCWRFQKDAYRALSEWKPEAKLIEAYIEQEVNLHGGWADNIGIFHIQK